MSFPQQPHADGQTDTPSEISRHTLPSDHPRLKLEQTVESHRKRWKLIVILEALGLGVSVTLGYLWLVFLLDHTVHLPKSARVIALAIFACFVGWLAIALWRRSRAFALSIDQVALAIEKRTAGGLGNRLINAVQLAREPQGNGQVAEHVVAENLAALESVRLEQARAVRPALVRLAVAAGLVAVGLGMWATNRASFSATFARVFDPLSNHDPLYRTNVSVLPGDVNAAVGQDVTLTIRVTGKIPSSIEVAQAAGTKRESQEIKIEPSMVSVSDGKKSDQAATVRVTLRGVHETTRYRVYAGDHQSPSYTIRVPEPARIEGFTSLITPPAYTGLAATNTQSTSGDIQALSGSAVDMTIKVGGKPDSLSLNFLAGLPEVSTAQGSAHSSDLPPTLNRPGTLLNPGRFAVKFGVSRDTSYQVVIDDKQTGQVNSPRYDIQSLPDRPATSKLIADASLQQLDAGQPFQWRVAAQDDIGLSQVGLMARQVQPGNTAAVEGAAVDIAHAGWVMVYGLPAGHAVKQGTFDHTAALAELGFTDGQTIELLPVASDYEPSRAGKWVAGQPVTFILGAELAGLQVEYEKILATQARLADHAKRQQKLVDQTLASRDVFDGKHRKDDAAWAKQISELSLTLAAEQSRLRAEIAGTVGMIPQSARHVRLSLGMIADHDVPSIVRLIDAVPLQDGPQQSLRALNMAMNSQSRVSQSFAELHNAFVIYRERWEEQNLPAMVKLLAQRQGALAEESTQIVSGSATRGSSRFANAIGIKTSMSTRQKHIQHLTQLVHTGMTQTAGRLARASQADIEAGMQPVGANRMAAFNGAAQRLISVELTDLLANAQGAAKVGQWHTVVSSQTAAAAYLSQTFDLFQNATDPADTIALNPDSQAVDKKPGTELAPAGETGVGLKDFTATQTAARKDSPDGKPIDTPTLAQTNINDYTYNRENDNKLNPQGPKLQQDFGHIGLGNKINDEIRFPNQSGAKPNIVDATPQSQVGDVIGDLLAEVERNEKDFETNSINTAWGLNEAGPAGRQAGDMNSTANAAVTGNQPPPQTQVGGVSGDGRKGSRGNGINSGDVANDLMGRSDPLDGNQPGVRQEGTMRREIVSGKYVEPAVGDGSGKRVEVDQNTYTKSSEGQWTKKMAEQMDNPSKVLQIVENDGNKQRFDPADLKKFFTEARNTQAQAIERVRAIRRQGQDMVLPDLALTESQVQLQESLDRLEANPSAAGFREYAAALSRLQSLSRVSVDFAGQSMPSDPRVQAVRGRVLDEPAWAVLPGYEESASVYFRGLSEYH